MLQLFVMMGMVRTGGLFCPRSGLRREMLYGGARDDTIVHYPLEKLDLAPYARCFVHIVAGYTGLSAVVYFSRPPSQLGPLGR